MSRDRSRPERTSEERERDRLERERRRAERAGAPPPSPEEISEPSQGLDEPLAPEGFEAHDLHIDEEGAYAHGSAQAQQPPPEYEQAPEHDPPPVYDAPVEPASEVGHPEPAGHDAPGEYVEGDATASEDVERHAAPAGYVEHHAAPAGYAERHAAPGEYVEHDPQPEHEPPVEPEPTAQDLQPQLPTEPEATSPEAETSSHPGTPEASDPPEPVILERRGERARARRRPAADDPEATQGYEIPGLPPEDPAPPPRQGLPEPPPRVGGAPMRRAFDRGASRAGAVGAVGPPRERARRGIGSRLAALVALAAVAVAVVLLVHSLKGSSKTKAPLAAPVVKVLIPEGKTRLQIAQIAKAAGLKGSYRTAARRSVLLTFSDYGAPKDTPDLEGFLFPATYDMNKGASVTRLVEEQVTAFQEHFGEEEAKRAKALGVTPYELLTVASMVEREAQVPGDRSKIAAVIYNRLKAGMPLGIDATIYYAVEAKENIPTYTRELTESQLQIDSPYNTRTHTGLPPTPISNPGVASIEAAAHPAHASYLYYVAGADGCGEQVFSTSQADFEANVAAYEEAKRKNGGKPPVCKKKH